MMKLSKVTIHRYKCFSAEKSMETERDITVLTGENDTGKTAVLEALAKANYFNREDVQFIYSEEKDYPRIRRKELEKKTGSPMAVTLEYAVSEELTAEIQEEMLLPPKYAKFSRTTDYYGRHSITQNGFSYEAQEFWRDYAKHKTELSEYVDELCKIKDTSSFRRLVDNCGSAKVKLALRKIEHFFENKMQWDNPISEYVYRTYLLPNIPRFLYYDEYYMLPSRVSLKKLVSSRELNPSEKTAKALLLLADADIGKLLAEDGLENTRILLEQMSREITEGFLQYWSVNQNLRIEFDLIKEETNIPSAMTGQEDKKREKGFWKLFAKEKTVDKRQEMSTDLMLEIRIYDMKNMVSLPVESRSRGFNWFLSFYIWFMAMEKTMDGECIFLLDEPGQNLHANSQEDLMRFLKHLAKKHQIILTTHSVPIIHKEEWQEKIRCIRSTESGTDIAKYQGGQQKGEKL